MDPTVNAAYVAPNPYSSIPFLLYSLSGGYPNVLCSPNCTTVSRLFSKDVTTWLFRLYWILFPEMSQLAITSLLEDIQMFCARQIALESPDSSPKMLPSGYFVSTGPCFQRCPNWLFCLCWWMLNVF